VRFTALLFLVAACATQAPGGKITGTAIYRERMALPPNAVFEATLEDVSKADAKAEVLGIARIENPGNTPIAFEIPYDASRIDPRHRYSVRARIVVGDRLLFITDRHYPVLTAGHGSSVALELRRASGSIHAGDAPLENTYWKLISLGDTAVQPVPNQREAHFVLHAADRRVAGSGGCNGIGGSYRLDGDNLSFGQMIRTMMACATGMDTENGLLAALGKARRARVRGQQLELLDAEARPLARFEAVYLR